VTVAVLGDPNHPFENFGASMPEEDFARPYAERPKLELEVEDDELLIDVLGRAAARLGIRPAWSPDAREGIAFVSFHVPQDEDRYERDLAELLGRGPWHTKDLAERLDCSEQEADAILWALGYTVDSAGYGGVAVMNRPNCSLSPSGTI
jgi:hypothetical protein